MQHPRMTEFLKKLGIEGNFLRLAKGIPDEPTAKVCAVAKDRMLVERFQERGEGVRFRVFCVTLCWSF